MENSTLGENSAASRTFSLTPRPDLYLEGTGRTPLSLGGRGIKHGEAAVICVPLGEGTTLMNFQLPATTSGRHYPPPNQTGYARLDQERTSPICLFCGGRCFASMEPGSSHSKVDNNVSPDVWDIYSMPGKAYRQVE